MIGAHIRCNFKLDFKVFAKLSILPIPSQESLSTFNITSINTKYVFKWEAKIFSEFPTNHFKQRITSHPQYGHCSWNPLTSRLLCYRPTTEVHRWPSSSRISSTPDSHKYALKHRFTRLEGSCCHVVTKLQRNVTAVEASRVARVPRRCDCSRGLAAWLAADS